ncbi:MAG: fumarylacetoacetate hydrolase family protein [Deltaproteobacteria bacterium]|nr:fumarylacetoacetate hydrolase family protein [Deltaproteobacteria bacterium]
MRFLFKDKTHYGILFGETVRILAAPPYEGLNQSGQTLPLDAVQLLAPCEPSKIIALGLNYRDHAEEMRLALPQEPLIFMKPSTSVIGPEAAIVYPPQSRRVDYEAELGLVIGRKAYQVPESKAHDYILGYTCVNDVTARDLQKKDGQFTRSKSFDTFCPLGPWIETDPGDPHKVSVESYVNGQRRQHSHAGNLVFGVATLVNFISNIMTLLPGDVIATGTPSGVGPLQPGDVVEIRLGGVGSLRNPVVSHENTSSPRSS